MQQQDHKANASYDDCDYLNYLSICLLNQLSCFNVDYSMLLYQHLSKIVIEILYPHQRYKPPKHPHHVALKSGILNH